MDITTRQMFLLLRAGVFGQQDRVEPMSVWKWRKTYQLTVAHGVEAEAYEGLEVVSDQFFSQIVPDDLRSQWAESADQARRSQREEPAPLPPRLAKSLTAIAEAHPQSKADAMMLESLARLACALMNDDYWVRHLLNLGELVRESGSDVNREQLQKWIRKLGLTRMAQLEGALLMQLAGVQEGELPMPMPRRPDAFSQQVDAIASAIPHGREQLEFQQGKHIFVHTNNANAMVWNARRSMRFFRYSPRESLSQLFSSFARSLTNIEE